MIKYIECRGKTLLLNGIIRPSTVIWQVDYNDTGAFQITVPYSKENFALLAVGNTVTRPNREDIGYIERIQITFSPTEGRRITASGKFGLVLLERRLYAYNSAYRCRTLIVSNGTTVENACRSVVGNVLIVPRWESRKVDYVALGALKGLSETTTERQSTYRNALEFTRVMLNNTVQGDVLGHRMRFDREQGKLLYEVYKGQNRQTERVFSQQFKNLLSFEYDYDKSMYKSRFLVGGDGQDKDRFYISVNRNNDSGADLAEFFYDAQSAQTYTDTSGTEHTLSNADYQTLLTSEIKGKFSEHYTAVSVKGSVDLSHLTYGTDYNVGDIVTIMDDGSNIKTTARIWSIVEQQDASGYSIHAEFEGN